MANRTEQLDILNQLSGGTYTGSSTTASQSPSQSRQPPPQTPKNDALNALAGGQYADYNAPAIQQASVKPVTSSPALPQTDMLGGMLGLNRPQKSLESKLYARSDEGKAETSMRQKILNLQAERAEAEKAYKAAQLGAASLQGTDSAANQNVKDARAKRDAIEEQLVAIDPNLGTPTLKERVGNTLSGSLKGAAGTTGTGIAFMGDWGRYGTEDSEDYALAEGAFNVVDDDYRKRMEQEAQASQAIREKSRQLSEDSASELARAKQGLGAGGRLAVDVASTGVQIASDALMNLLTGGIAGTAAMGLRSFGGAVEQAQADGATMNETMAYAAATGAKDLILNKLLGGLGRVYGDSKTGKAIASMIDNYAGSPSQKKLLSTALNALSEGGEEIAEAVVGNALKSIYNDKGMLENVTDEELGDYLYEGLIGAILGGATEGIGSITDGRQGSNTENAAPMQGDILDDITNGKLAETPTQPQNTSADVGNRLVLPVQAEAATERPDKLNSAPATSKQASITNGYSNGRYLAAYTSETAEHLRKEGKSFRNVIAGVDISVKDFFSKWKNGRKSHLGEKLEKLYLGEITDEAREKLSDLLGYEVTSKDYILTNDDIKHIMDEHGDPQTEIAHGNAPITDAIIESLPEVLANPDSIELGHNEERGNRDGIVYKKTLPDGTVVYVQFDNSGRGTIEGRTIYVKPKDTTTPGVNADNSTNTFTSETAGPVAETSVSTERITRTSGKNKSNIGLQTTSEAAEMASMGTSASPYEAQIAAYGAIPKGENPARDVSVPAQVGEGTKISQAARTVMEAEATPETVVPQIRDAVMGGRLSYIPVSNQELAQSAKNKIADEGWQSALDSWRKQVWGGKVNAELVAMGAELLNNAGNAENLDSKLYIDLLADYQDLATRAGQAVSAMRILKTLTPSGKLYMVQRSIQRIMQDAEGKYEVKLDKALADEYLKQTDDAGRDKVMGQIMQSIADQIPASFGEKWNAWRYLSMLGNLKTQARNVIGNAASLAAQKASNRIGAVLELALPPEQRTKSFAPKALRKEAMQDFAEVEAAALGNAKFDEVYMAMDSDIQNRRKIFDSKILEGYRKLTNVAMEGGDKIFSKLAYADALAGWLNARGVKSLADADEATLEAARNYAIQKAQEATFRDNNQISQLATSMGRIRSNSTAAKTWNAAVSAILPFRKTPANVLVRAEEYSPLGILNTGVKAIQAVSGKGDVTGADVIDSLSKSISGTALFALGYMLSNAGILQGHEDDEEIAKFENQQGLQEYALLLNNGKSVTLDWLSPLAIPLFMGAELAEALSGETSGDVELASAMLGAISGPMLEMSMLSGVNDLLSNLASYDGAGEALPKLGLNILASYLMQGIPQLLAQAEQASQKYRQTSYTKRDSVLSSDMQYLLSKASSKIPGWDYQQQDYIDAWGRVQEQGKGLEGTFNAFVNPAYIGADRSTEVDAELERLQNAGKDIEGWPNVLPQKGSRTMDIGGGERMSHEEYQEYSVERGQKSLELVKQFMATDGYKTLSDEQRAEVISQLYQFAADRAKKTVQAAHDIEYNGDWDDEARLSNLPEYLAAKTVFKDATDDEKNRGYDAIDALLGTVRSMDMSTQRELERNSDIKALMDLKGEVGAEAYYETQDAIAATTKASRSDANILEGILNAGLTPDEEKAMLAKEIDGKTIPGIYDAFTAMGLSGRDALNFFRAADRPTASHPNGNGSLTKTEAEAVLGNYASNEKMYDEIMALLFPKK